MGKRDDDHRGDDAHSRGITLIGTHGDDSLVGGAGNDLIIGGSGNDTLMGGAGNDTLIGGRGNDVLDGGDGNDLLIGGSGNNTIGGGAGNDTLIGGHGNDVLDGGDGNDLIFGGSGNNTIGGGAGNDLIFGGNGNNLIDGGDGNDLIVAGNGNNTIGGGAGDDRIFVGNGNNLIDGGAGNDLIVAGHGNNTIGGGSGDDVIFGGNGNDVLDGGAGNDKVFGGGGNDTLIYSMSENLGPGFTDIGTHDVYDGGRGTDTLDLTLTYGEDLLPAVQKDIADFQAFLAGNTHGGDKDHGHDDHDHGHDDHGHDDGHGQTFHFTAFDLDVKNVESLSVVLVNNPPTANPDSGATNEDTALNVAAPGVLANDTDPDHLDVLKVSASDPQSVMGAVVGVGADGGYSYDPTHALDLQALAQGETAIDTFGYTISDLAGATSSTTVSITVTGVNDPPVAHPDFASTDEDTPISFGAANGLLSNDTDVDHHHVLSVAAVDPQTQLHVPFTVNPDGSWSYDPTVALNYLSQGETATDTFNYTVSDEYGATDHGTVTITVAGVNDPPTANNDTGATDEDTPLVVSAANGLLANDTDPDHLDHLTVASFDKTSADGAAVVVNPDGSYSYDPTGSATLQALNTGESAVDNFSYTISDGHGGTSTATVAITVAGITDTTGGGNAGPVLPSTDPGTPLEYFIKFTGDGIGTDWLDLGSFDLGFSAPASSSTGGAGAGKVMASDIGALLGSNSTIPDLVQALTEGQALKSVEIEVYDEGKLKGDETLVDQYYFQNVKLTGLDAETGSGAPAVNQLNFDYEQYNHKHADIDPATGETTPPVSAGFDFLQDKTFSGGPAFEGDAIKSPVNPDAGTLTYYVHFDGADGWLQLSSFSTALQNAFSTGGAGGGAGRATASDAFLVLGSSSELVDLESSLMKGEALKNVEIEAYQAGVKDLQLVDEYHFENVLLTGFNTFNATFNELQFDFARFSDGHIKYDDTGAAVSSNVAGWDFVQNEPFSAGAPQADAVNGTILNSAPPGQPLDYFIKFTGSGVGTDWLSLGSFNLGFENSGSVSAGGAGAGKVTASDVATMLGSSGTIPELLQSLAEGQLLKSVEIEAYNPAGIKGETLVDQYYFQNVALADLSVSTASGVMTANSLGFDYAQFDHKHVDITDTGQPTTPVESGWDFLQQQPFSGGPSFSGDAVNSPVSPDAGALTYYVHFDGANGWLKVDSFTTGLENSGSLGGAGGGAGHATASDAELALGSSSELVALSDSLVKGEVLKNVEIEAYQAGIKGEQLVDEYNFENVLLHKMTADAGQGDALSFDFGRFSQGHVTYDSTGALDSTTVGGWDFIQNQPFSAGTPVADAVKDTISDSTPANSLDYFIKFTGSGIDSKWLDLNSFNFDIDNSGTLGGGGAGAGKPAASEVTALLGSSSTIPQLMLALTEGELLKSVEIEGYQSGGSKDTLVDQYYFENVQLAGLSLGNGFGAVPTDSLTFDFAKYVHSHADIDSTGQSTPPVESGFDFSSLTSFTGGPSFAGDAVNSPINPAAGPLNYYVHFDGADGWLKLSSFSSGIANSASIGGSGGAGAGQATAADAELFLGSSSEMLKLESSLFTGEHLKDVEIEAYNTSGKAPTLVDEFHFDNVQLTGLSSANATDNGVSLNFTRFSDAHVTYSDTGAVESTTAAGWDFQTDTHFTPVAPHPDIDFTG